MNLDQLEIELTRDEGRREHLYKDSVGKLTIGVGHCIDDIGITDEVIDLIFKIDVAETMKQLDSHIPWWRNLSEVRQRVICNMCFQMGIVKLMGFQKTLAHIHNGEYDEAAREMLDSLWAQQVPDRAKRLSEMMRAG